MPSTMLPAAAIGLPIARLPHRMTIADEFIQLVDLRGRVERRLTELAHVLDGNDPREPVTLPKNGLPLRAVRPGFFLFEGGRADA